MTLRFQRYVAIGDSSTEGLQDPDGAGGYRGWANRLAERVAQAQGGLLYANLGVRGKRSREIREEQLGPALAMTPDLATVFAGYFAWRNFRRRCPYRNPLCHPNRPCLLCYRDLYKAVLAERENP